MINRTTTLVTGEQNPYWNLALEEQLLAGLMPSECILYLWQNRNTVVIGRNQNAWRECRVEALKEAGGFLARRFSGGGAVYHDSGNLNFTFVAHKADYDEDKQLLVIQKALEKFGLKTEKTGRNDLVCEGRKFSGNAFYHQGDVDCHHGTLLLDVNTEKMQEFLHVSEKKLKSKGVQSVKSRVVNLKELCPQMTLELLEENLFKAFQEVYGCAPKPLLETRIDWAKVKERAEFLSSWEWLYGRKIPFQTEWTDRFSWGEIQIQAAVDEGIIRDVQIYTDAMALEFVEPLKNGLTGQPYGETAMEKALDTAMDAGGKDLEALMAPSMREDLIQLWKAHV